MRGKLRFILAPAFLALLALCQPRAAAAQDTGGVKGQVRVCSLSGNETVEESAAGVPVYMIKERAKVTFPFTVDQCGKGPLKTSCRSTSTDSEGNFGIAGVTVDKWQLFAYKRGYVQSKTVKVQVVSKKVIDVKPPTPPLPPFRVRKQKNSRCADESAQAAPGAAPRDSAGSAPAAPGRGGVEIVLVASNRRPPAPRARGRQVAVLKGKVVDANKGELQGAEIAVTDIGPKQELGGTSSAAACDPSKATTDEHGQFDLTLKGCHEEGLHLFSVTLKGFETYFLPLEEAVKTFAPGTHLAEVVLSREGELGEDEETTLIETVEPTRRHVFTPEVMQTLPLQGTRSFDEFALLAPGVLPPPETFGGVGPGVSAGVGTAGQFAVNGLRSRENNFTADGSDNNDEDIGTRRQGFIMTVPQPVESVQELQVITALPDARFGRNIGGQVNVLTKTGGPGTFHGSAYAYTTDARLNARDPFDQTSATASEGYAPRRASDGAPVLLDGAPLFRGNQVGDEDQFTRVQLGLAAGGEYRWDTAYFVSLERQDVRASKEAHFAVPSVRQRGAFDSGDTGLLLDNKQNPSIPLYPASVPGDAVLSLFPFPNNPRGPYGENTYSTTLPADGRGTRFSFKADKRFGGNLPDCEKDPEKRKAGSLPKCGNWFARLFKLGRNLDQLTGRYNFTDELSTLPVTGGALFSSLRPKVRIQNLAFFLNRTLSGTTSDTIRLSVGHTSLSFGERRDAAMLASSALPGEQFLLNAPLLLNVTRPNPDGTLNAPRFVSAAGQGAAVLSALGYQGVTQTEQITGPLGQVFVAGFSPLGVDAENFPQERANKTYQAADTITSFLGPHVFTFGVDMRKTRIHSTLDRNFRPRAVFHGLPSVPFADIVERPGAGPVQAGVVTGATLAAAGVPTALFQTLARPPSSGVGIHFTQVNLFFQDQWRWRPNLHLTFGMRYELNTVPDTVGRRLENAFDPEELRTLAENASRFCQPNARCTDLVGAVTAAFPADFKVSYGSDRNDFDVRLGFAWVPSWLKDTSVRGGFASYSGQFPGIVIDQSRNAFPDFLPLNLANFPARELGTDRTYLFNLASPAIQQLLPMPGGVPSGITPGTLNRIETINPLAFLVNQIFDLQGLTLSPTIFGLDLVLPQRELKPPYAFHYGVTAERQFAGDYLASVAYVGTRGVGLLRVSTPELGLNNSRFAGAVTVGPLAQAEPFPLFQGRIAPPQPNLISSSFVIAPTMFESNARSSYNSLQAELRRRYRGGFLFGSAFTYSHSIDDASDFFDTAGAFALPQNSLSRDERAPSNFDVRLRSATHFVLDFQREWFGRHGWEHTRKGWLRSILGGLQLAGVFTAQTGQPYTVNSALDINRDGNLTDRLNTTAGVERVPGRGPVQLRLAPGVNPRDLLAAEGRDGSVGRNTFRTRGQYSFDLAVTDHLPTFGEGKRFIVRVEFFNLFNWANYGVPVRTLESPGFGTSLSTRTPPRTIQVVGKFHF